MQQFFRDPRYLPGKRSPRPGDFAESLKGSILRRDESSAFQPERITGRAAGTYNGKPVAAR